MYSHRDGLIDTGNTGHVRPGRAWTQACDGYHGYNVIRIHITQGKGIGIGKLQIKYFSAGNPDRPRKVYKDSQE